MSKLRASLGRIKPVFRVAGPLALLAISLLVYSHLRRYGALDLLRLLDDTAANLGTALLGAAFTVLGLDWLIGQRQLTRELQRAVQDQQQAKVDLIKRMGSQNNLEALRAVDELRVRGWLQDGSLRGADLRAANLRGASLQDADLTNAVLWSADLQESNLLNANLESANLQGAVLKKTVLFGANLKRADLQEADMRGAGLWSANLQEATLWNADLEGATLRQANLQGTNLFGANLRGVVLFRVYFNASTTLPNGSTWTPETHMSCFTYPDHPNFWRSEYPDSPAYRGQADT